MIQFETNDSVAPKYFLQRNIEYKSLIFQISVNERPYFHIWLHLAQQRIIDMNIRGWTCNLED